MSLRRRLAVTVSLAAALGVVAPAGAGAATWATTSSNWAGYAVSQPGVRFRRVSGTWVAPTVTCTSARRRYSAAWLGLGGLHTTAAALEQVGTEADCVGGRAVYSAWYELVPAAPVTFHMTVRPGDTISAAVTVSGSSVKLYLADLTTGASFSKTMRAASVDTSSAEWIVEAPSACVDNGACRTLALADFGTTTFGRTRTTSATGHSGTITDPAWSSVAITLASDRGPGAMRFASDGRSNASPAQLSAAGDAFAVDYGVADGA